VCPWTHEPAKASAISDWASVPPLRPGRGREGGLVSNSRPGVRGGGLFSSLLRLCKGGRLQNFPLLHGVKGGDCKIFPPLHLCRREFFNSLWHIHTGEFLCRRFLLYVEIVPPSNKTTRFRIILLDLYLTLMYRSKKNRVERETRISVRRYCTIIRAFVRTLISPRWWYR